MMITQDSYPIDIAYEATHEVLQNLVCGACAIDDIRLKWKAARTLLLVERMMGTSKRFTDSIRDAVQVRPWQSAGNGEMIQEALVVAAASLDDLVEKCDLDTEGPPVRSVKRARTMIRDAIKSVFENTSAGDLASDASEPRMKAGESVIRLVACSSQMPLFMEQDVNVDHRFFAASAAMASEDAAWPYCGHDIEETSAERIGRPAQLSLFPMDDILIGEHRHEIDGNLVAVLGGGPGAEARAVA